MKYNHTEYKKGAAPKAEDPGIAWANARIASLNRLLGTNIGAKKERKRLESIINHKK